MNLPVKLPGPGPAGGESPPPGLYITKKINITGMGSPCIREYDLTGSSQSR